MFVMGSSTFSALLHGCPGGYAITSVRWNEGNTSKLHRRHAEMRRSRTAKDNGQARKARGLRSSCANKGNAF